MLEPLSFNSPGALEESLQRLAPFRDDELYKQLVLNDDNLTYIKDEIEKDKDKKDSFYRVGEPNNQTKDFLYNRTLAAVIEDIRKNSNAAPQRSFIEINEHSVSDFMTGDSMVLPIVLVGKNINIFAGEGYDVSGRSYHAPSIMSWLLNKKKVSIADIVFNKALFDLILLWQMQNDTNYHDKIQEAINETLELMKKCFLIEPLPLTSQIIKKLKDYLLKAGVLFVLSHVPFDLPRKLGLINCIIFCIILSILLVKMENMDKAVDVVDKSKLKFHSKLFNSLHSIQHTSPLDQTSSSTITAARR